MGIMATGRRVCHCRTDKDLKQVPGVHYNWRTDCMERVTTPDADYWFYFQVLTGDSTDGYSGCPVRATPAKRSSKGPARPRLRLSRPSSRKGCPRKMRLPRPGWLVYCDAMTTTSSGAGRYCGARALTGREGGEEDSMKSVRSVMPGQ